jgi:putative aldouronate transport system permease protein
MKETKGEKIFGVFNALGMCLLVVITLYPFLNVVAISFNDSLDTVRGGVGIWPRQFTLNNYKRIFEMNSLNTAIFMSTLRTLVGVFFGVIGTAMLSFVLSRKDFVFRKLLGGMFILTMYVSGGMIPEYMLIRSLGLFNNFWVYILPGIVSVFNVFVLKSYMDGLPIELQESGKIDGANDFVIFIQIILPLCKPVLATIGLFVAVGQWNAWFDTYLYNSSSKTLTTLQYELQKILSNAQISSGEAIRGKSAEEIARMVSPESIRMAMTVVATLPIVCVYPFVQRYFVHGLTLGAVKS